MTNQCKCGACDQEPTLCICEAVDRFFEDTKELFMDLKELEGKELE